MSVFLMGCYDPACSSWCTVTKVHGGHDDDTLKKLQKQLKMTKISKVGATRQTCLYLYFTSSSVVILLWLILTLQ